VNAPSRGKPGVPTTMTVYMFSVDPFQNGSAGERIFFFPPPPPTSSEQKLSCGHPPSEGVSATHPGRREIISAAAPRIDMVLVEIHIHLIFFFFLKPNIPLTQTKKTRL